MAKSTKERVWLAEYYKCLNATEAGRRAGYKHPSVRGAEKKLKFADEIKAYLEEKTLEAEAVLARLSDMALASLADFSGVLTLDDLRDHPKAHLVKKLRTVAKESDTGRATIDTTIELHDAQAALEKLARHYGLFTDRLDVNSTVNVLTTNEWTELRSLILVTLAAHPEAKAAVIEALKRIDSESS